MRLILLLFIFSLFIPFSSSYAGFDPRFFINETDTSAGGIYLPFDLRDRESFFQVTNYGLPFQGPMNITIHVQIYNVANLCNENNFFDVYTPNDTHVYNIRDILTNDGNPSGIYLPENAYGIVFISAVVPEDIPGEAFDPIVGNFRIIDNSGYEYRSNAQGFPDVFFDLDITESEANSTFNFNKQNGVVLSDIFGIPISTDGIEADLDDVLNVYAAVDVDIVDNNEVLFSCRDVIFACIDENNPLIEELIANVGNTITRSSASVARFEYGINNAIPHSKGNELLCPGNNIVEGVVKLTLENFRDGTFLFAGYVGLNNGNGRGSMDSFINKNIYIPNQDAG